MPERKIDKRHHDYPAWDLAIPTKTPVRAVHAGRIRSVTRWGACGRGVIIRGRDGFEYTYCHGSWVLAKKNRWVQAGQKIMLSGSTGHSTGPHLHLQIKGPRGGLLCPQPLLKRWARGRQVSPRATTARGCAYSPDRPSYRSPPRDRRPARAASRRRPRRRAGRSRPARAPTVRRPSPRKPTARPAGRPSARKPTARPWPRGPTASGPTGRSTPGGMTRIVGDGARAAPGRNAGGGSARRSGVAERALTGPASEGKRPPGGPIWRYRAASGP